MASVNVIAPWCDKIGRESAGKMKCQVFPAMSMGGTPQQLVDQVKDGVADLVITLPGYTAGRFPALEVFELPFMTNSAEVGARATIFMPLDAPSIATTRPPIRRVLFMS